MVQSELSRNRRGAVALIAVGGLLAILSACSEPEQTDELRVTGVVGFDGEGATIGCDDAYNPVIYTNIGEAFRTDGTPFLDRGHSSLFASLCVRNEGTSEVRLYEYDLAVDGGAETARELSDVVVVPGGRATIEVQVLAEGDVAVLAEELGQGQATEVVAGLAIHGRTALGTEVETPEFFFPIRLYRLDFLCVCDGDPAAGEFACPEDDAGCM